MQMRGTFKLLLTLCVCHCYPCYVTVTLVVSLLPLVCHHYRLSYDVDIQVSIGIGPDKKSSYNKVDLKNPYFRFASMAPAPPPDSSDGSKANKVAN